MDEFVLSRFWAKVNKDGPVPAARPELGPCWLWTATKSVGYGNFNIGGKIIKAHRVAWEIENGPIPDGIQVDHRCLNRPCVRPSHLRAATHKQNAENQPKLPTRNTSGVRGVTWDKKRNRWYATVTHNRKSHYVGSFKVEDLEMAREAVMKKRNELFTHNDIDSNSALAAATAPKHTRTVTAVSTT